MLFPPCGMGQAFTQVLSVDLKYKGAWHVLHWLALFSQVKQLAEHFLQIRLSTASPNSSVAVHANSHCLVELLPQYGGGQEKTQVAVDMCK